MSFDEQFHLFYYGDGDGGYLRKEQRGDARKALKGALKVATIEEIVAGRKRHTEYHRRMGTEQKFIKLPAGWLRAEGWADEYDEPVKRDWWDARKADDEFKRRLKVVK